jgi:hypothetical protein
MRGRNGDLNSKGGQGVVRLKLCLDCKHRPTGRAPPHACGMNPDLDAYDARQCCGGDFFELRP